MWSGLDPELRRQLDTVRQMVALRYQTPTREWPLAFVERDAALLVVREWPDGSVTAYISSGEAPSEIPQLPSAKPTIDGDAAPTRQASLASRRGATATTIDRLKAFRQSDRSRSNWPRWPRTQSVEPASRNWDRACRIGRGRPCPRGTR